MFNSCLRAVRLIARVRTSVTASWSVGEWELCLGLVGGSEKPCWQTIEKRLEQRWFKRPSASVYGSRSRRRGADVDLLVWPPADGVQSRCYRSPCGRRCFNVCGQQVNRWLWPII